MSQTTMVPEAVLEFQPLRSQGVLDNLYRMTADQYERLVETGVLDGQPIELINGLLVRKTGKKPPDVIACEAMRDELLPLLPYGWRLTIEAPIRIPNFNEPELDLAIPTGFSNQRVLKANEQTFVMIDAKEVGQIVVSDILPRSSAGVETTPENNP